MGSSVSWMRAEGAAPWLVTSRPDSAAVVAGITFGAGWMHQPTAHLGVLPLLAARLTTGLTRPVEAADADSTVEPAEVTLSIGQTDCSLVVAGTVEAVCDTLRRVDRVLADPVSDELLDTLRSRALSYSNPLKPWCTHLVTRWPGHRAHLSALGALALDTLDRDALTSFAAQFATAGRVYWTNEPTVADLLGPVPTAVSSAPAAVSSAPAAVSSAPAGGSVAPQGWRDAPGCVERRNAGELFTIAVRQSPAMWIGLTLLARSLHRRMVEFEPLALAVGMSQYDLGGEVALVCGDANVVAGKDGAAVAAVAETLEDLATGAPSAEAIAQARSVCVNGALSAEMSQPSGIVPLARQHLRLGDFTTPERNAGELERVSDEQVVAALAEHQSQLLLAVAEPSDTAPYPMAATIPARAPEGRRFRDWTLRTHAVRCSQRRLSIVATMLTGRKLGRRPRPVTVSSVDFDEAVLRIDGADQQTTLLDQRLRVATVVWGKYRHSTDLRALVDQRTAGVPVIRQPGDPEWPARLATLARKRRRELLLMPVWLLAGVALVVVVSIITNRDSRPVDVALDQAATATLPNGSTLSIVGNPELIEHYDAYTANLYTVQLRMCGGTDRVRNGIHEARNYFGQEKFTLHFGEQSATPRLNIGSLPAPRGGYVVEGECATGWLLLQLPTPTPTEPLTLRYTNIKDDSVVWRLPADPPLSPLSKPCPAPTAAPGPLAQPPWVGCP